jgi:hypothetical protein
MIFEFRDRRGFCLILLFTIRIWAEESQLINHLPFLPHALEKTIAANVADI